MQAKTSLDHVPVQNFVVNTWSASTTAERTGHKSGSGQPPPVYAVTLADHEQPVMSSSGGMMALSGIAAKEERPAAVSLHSQRWTGQQAERRDQGRDKAEKSDEISTRSSKRIDESHLLTKTAAVAAMPGEEQLLGGGQGQLNQNYML